MLQWPEFKPLLDRFFTFHSLKSLQNIQTNISDLKKPKKSISLKSSRELTEIQVKHKYINIYKYLYIIIYILYIYINILTQIIQVIVYFISSATPSNISSPILRATP